MPFLKKGCITSSLQHTAFRHAIQLLYGEYTLYWGRQYAFVYCHSSQGAQKGRFMADVLYVLTYVLADGTTDGALHLPGKSSLVSGHFCGDSNDCR